MNTITKKLDQVKKSHDIIIQNILKDIYENYDIYYKSTEHLIDKQILIDRFSYKQEEKVQCSAIKPSGERCSLKTISKYCGKHRFYESKYQSKKPKNDIIIEFDEDKRSICTSEKSDNSETTFINNKFYYYNKSVDNFFYESNTNEKVGYIDKDDQFIFSDNPFELTNL